MGKCDKDASFEILDHFYTNGGNFIDTASNYQNEQSETWIGEWMAARGNRDQLVIATKYTTGWTVHKGYDSNIIHANFGGNGAKSLHLSVQASLKKLQTDYIDLLYVHWWDFTTSVEELMTSLNHLVAVGKVLYLGISDTPAWIVSKANQYARDHGLRPFSVYQGRWSVGERDFEREIIPMCQAEGMALAPWGALGGGKYKSAEARKSVEGRKAPSGVSEKDIKISEALEVIAVEKGSLITSVALAYVMHKAPYVFPIVGGRNIEHLKGNIEALSLGLSAEDIDRIESAVPFDYGFPNTMIGTSKKGAYGPADSWLSNNRGSWDYVEAPKARASGWRMAEC
jgi:aryl-alcohol dehydrogenase-like predicted oxidoreductase